MGNEGNGQQQAKGRSGREKAMFVVFVVVVIAAVVYYFAMKGNPTATKAVDTVKQGTHDAAVQVEKATEPAKATPPKR
jgi:flagellar basal body-associated protein FliL